MRDSAQIQINDAHTEVRLVWAGFDGDDCFSEFYIEVASEGNARRFSFGPCAVHGLRKVSRFFRDNSQESVSLGFRHAIRYCDVFRTDSDYRLVLRFEGGELSEQRFLEKPSIQLADEFLTEYST